MGVQSVKIPVELQLTNIQGQINNLRKALSGVKEGTSAYKSLNTVLQQLERQFTAIQVESKRAFTSQGQINHFANSIEKLGNLAATFQERMSEVDLKDFNIDLTAFNAAEKKVKDLSAELEQLKSGKIGQELFDNLSLEELSKKLKIDTTKDSLFSEVILELDNAYKAIDENIDKMYKQAERAKDARQQFAKGLGKSIGKGEFSKDIEALAKANSTTSITAASRDSATTDLLASLGLNLKGVKSSGNTAAEYISSVTQSISAKIKEHNAKVQKEINSLTKTKSDLEDALDLVSELKNNGQKNLSQEDKDNIFSLTGINITQKSIESAQAHLNDLIRKSLAATQKQESSLIKIDNATIQQAATNAAKQLQIDSKIQAKAFVLEVTKLLQAGGMQQNAKDLEMLPGEELPNYISRLTEMVRQRGIELREEYSNIITDIKTQEDLLDQTSDTQFKLGEANLDRTTLQIPQVEEDLNKAKEGLDQAGQAAKDSVTSVKQAGDAYEEIGKDIDAAGDKAQGAAQQLDQMTDSARRLENVQNAIKQWFGFNEVINLTKRAISDAINHIRELDKVMTEIAVVTDMTQDELWDQISTYSAMAQKYGATTQGVYEVSQLYYQQGLQTAEVMQLTEETLKMAKIAGLDYADATDYMTVAIRGFKLEMSDAQNIVDVYSNIAAVTASDTEELAVAMSKTASSAEAVGSSFENTTAMIALMVETTREAPENIGSAMKSIISRYGEMTTNPAALVDSEGEAMSLNKVDKALSSVGITLQDVNGQFRDFDEVILELSSKWDTIDKNTQRYIATVMAGNRQQSRFLALVGNYDRLSELYEEAANSQDAATLQTLKTMDSIETKINQLKTTFQEFYTNTGIEDLIKGLLDFATIVIERIDSIPKAFDKIPVAALGMIGTLITTGKAGISLLMRGVFQVFDSVLPEVKVKGVKIGEYLREGIKQGVEGVGQEALKELNISRGRAKWGTALASAGSLVSTLALTLGDLKTEQGRVTSGWFQIAGGAASAIGQVLTGNYIGAAITAVSTLTSAIATMEETTEEKIDRLKKNVEESSEQTLLAKDELKTLRDYKKKYIELSAAQHTSSEAKEEFINLQNEIANKYPEFIRGLDSEGNYLVSLTENYENLLAAKEKAYDDAFIENAMAQIEALSDLDYRLNSLGIEFVEQSEGWFLDTLESIQQFILGDNVFGSPSKTDNQNTLGELLKTGSMDSALFMAGSDYMSEDAIFQALFNSDKPEELGGTWGTIGESTILYAQDVGRQIDTWVSEGLSYSEINEQLSILFGKQVRLDTELWNYYSAVNGSLAYIENMLPEKIKALNRTMTKEELTRQDFSSDYALEEELINRNIQAQWEAFLAGSPSTADQEQLWLEFYNARDTHVQEAQAAITENFDQYSIKLIEEANRIFSSPQSYSLEYLQNLPIELKNILGESLYTELLNSAQKTFDEASLGIDQIFASADENNFIDLTEWNDIPEVLKFMLQTYSQEFYDAYLKQVETILKSRNFSEAGKQATLSNFLLFGSQLKAFRTEDQQYQIDQILTSADLTSLEGIFTLGEQLENLDFLAEEGYKFDSSIFVSELIPNLISEWDSLTNTLTSSIKDFTDALGNAASGMNFEEALAMANKLGLTVKDFTFKNGKYFLDSANRLNEYLEKEQSRYDALIRQTEAAIGSEEVPEGWLTESRVVSGSMFDSMLKMKWGGETFKEMDFSEQLEHAQLIIGSHYSEQELIEGINYFNQYIDAYQEAFANGAFTGTFTEYVVSELQKASENYEAASEYARWEINNTLFQLGDIMTALDNIFGGEDWPELDWREDSGEEVWTAITSGDYSTLTENTIKALSPYLATINETAGTYLEETWSQIAENLDGKGLIIANNFNQNYLRNLSGDNGILEKVSEGIYRVADGVTISAYAEALRGLNLTEEQINEQLQKVHDYFSTQDGNKHLISESLISILENIENITYDQIIELANNLGMDAEEVKSIFNFSDLDGDGIYTTSLANIKNIASQFGVGLTSEIQDAVNNYFNDILGIISNGLDGSMSNIEFDSLNKFFTDQGFNLDLSAIQTAEGLKLTENSLLKIYSTLKGVNSLVAQVVLDELAESAMDSDESLNNIYNVMNKIADINKKIAEAGADSEREKALRAELAVAENIRDTLMEAGNAFNFMDQDLPTSLSNPLSMREGISDALAILDGEEFKNGEGYIDYTDFYNMLNMMQQAGVDLRDVGLGLQEDGTQFNSSADLFTALMQEAASALTTVDGKTVVDLSQFGDNFKIGAEGMRNGLAEGIQIIAENQIDMIDAEIALLETVVASQEAFDKVAGEDNVIDVEDLIPDINGDGIIDEWSEDQLVVFQQLEKYLPGLMLETIDGTKITIQQLIEDPSLWSSITESHQHMLANLAQALHEVFDGTDWNTLLDGNNLQQIQNRLNTILANYGYQVTLDPNKFTQNINFPENASDEQIRNSLLEVLGQSNWEILGTEWQTAIVEKVKEALNNGESFNIQDILQMDIPEEVKRALVFALGEVSEIELPDDAEPITVIGERELESEFFWSENSRTAWYDGKKLGTFATKEEAEQALLNHLALSEEIESNNYTISGTASVDETTSLAYNVIYDDEETVVGYQYNGINYSDYDSMLAQMKADITPSASTSSTDETTITTTNKVILSSDNIVLETTGEGEQVILKPIASAKAEVTELILTPAEGGTKLAEELTPTIASINANATELNLTPAVNGLKLAETEEGYDLGAFDASATTITITPDETKFPAEHTISFETADGSVKTLSIVADSYTPSFAEGATQTNAETFSVDATAASGTVNLRSYKVSTLDSAGNVVDTITVNGTAELTATILGLSQDITGGYIIDGISGDAIINADPANAESTLNTLFTTWNNKEILFNVVTSYTPSSGVDLSAADKQKVAGLADNTSTLDSAVTTFIGNKDKFVLAYNAIKTAVENGIPISQEDINLLNGMSEAIEAMGENSLDSFAKELSQTASSAEQLSNVSTSVVNTATTLSNLNLAQTAMFLAEMASNGQILISLDFSNFGGLEGTIEFIASQIQAIVDDINGLDGATKTIYINEIRNSSGGGGDTTTTTTSNFNVNINSGAAQTQLNAVSAALTRLSVLSTTTSGMINNLITKLTNLRNAIAKLPDRSSAVNNTANAMNRLKSKNVSFSISGTASISTTATITVNVRATSPQSNVTATVVGGNKTVNNKKDVAKPIAIAKGNIALAKGGAAKAAGTRKTLMGELGPELVVSNGRYFTVGNDGAEFVDLPDDAIVFNHLQTKKLLGSGGMVGTGEPITNERKAVAFASGNISGPAMASASDALAELYKLRAMWQGLLDASASELGGKAGGQGLGSGKGPGGGGGGPGGGGGGGGSGEEIASVVGDLDRWYNLLRQIAKLEQQITMEQAKRENMRNGYDRNGSLEKELKLLQKQYNAQKKLSEIQKSYYDARRADLNATDYSKIFTYDEDGLMQYVDGQGRGLDILATLNKTDKDGKAIYDAKEQLDYLKNIVNFDTDVLKTNADGTKAEDEEQMMQNFWDGIDGWMEEMDSLYDSYNDAAIAMEEATTAMNEILQEQIDNQLAVEEKLMKALEAREQAEIDRIQDEKDALEEAAQEYIDGLNETLEKERAMYDKNESDAETARLQRRLAILQRSGGSASEIKSLQDQIDSRLKDSYFQEQQDQINAIQEASDNQIQKLQEQIDLMTETLEYQKENGLLWTEIHEMMLTMTPEALLQFIMENDPDYKQNSPTQNQEDAEETRLQLEQQADYQRQQQEKAKREQDWAKYYEELDKYSQDQKEEYKEGAKKAFMDAYTAEGGSLEKAIAASNAYYENKINPSKGEDENDDDDDNGGGEDDKPITGKGKVKTSGSNLNVRSGPGTKYGKIGKLKNKSSVTLTGYKNGWYQIDYNGKTGYVHGDYISTSDKKKLPAFASGGLVDFTGPAWVDGSKSKPEAFLSAEDTAMLKSKIFSNSDGSLKALVAALEAITSDTSKYSATTTTESIIIQNAQVNIQPGTISNDYDARRAGEMALEEMVKIARKTTNRVVSR